ncbi:MAG: flagellar biosynthetic protein FliO [Pseudolabrys sp.]
MFETLFGSGMPLAARFFIAFLVVLALIGVTAWLVRRFGASRLGGGSARGRQPRLAVIDAASVDGRRRLVLIRRDNVEHLLMIGGPTDVVVEPNIVRAGAAREAAREPGRPAPEIPVRGPVPVENAWPLQPLGEPTPAAPSRPYRAGVTEEPWLAPEPGARPRPAETFAPDFAAPPRHEPAPRVAPPLAAEPPLAPQADHNLAEMAQQLEAALRRAPMAEGRPPVTDPFAQPPAPQVKPAEPPRAPARDLKPRVEPKLEPKFEPTLEPRVEPTIEAAPEPRPEAKPEPLPEPKVESKREPAPAKTVYDNLEEEMASLLGRPSGKT